MVLESSSEGATRPVLLLVGSGSRARNEGLLADLADSASLVLLQPGSVTWQGRYVRHAEPIDPADPVAVLALAGPLALAYGAEAVVSYEETLLPLAAELGHRLGLPAIPCPAAAVVRDKSLQRAALASVPLRPTRSIPVRDAESGVRAAAEIGYPVVLKPANLSGSLGVTVVPTAQRFRDRFADVRSIDTHGLPRMSSVLVEELLDGPEFSVDCWVLDGTAGPLFTGLVTKGFQPNLINVRCVVGRGIAEPDVLAAVQDAACLAAVACGLDRAIANVDLRWMHGEARILEVNGRPGGELLPRLARLASGLRMGQVLADVSLGKRPTDPPPPGRAAGVAFLFPPAEMRFGGLATGGHEHDAGVEEIATTAAVGDRVVPPPADPWGRVGWALVTGPASSDVDAHLDRLQRDIGVLCYQEQA